MSLPEPKLEKYTYEDYVNRSGEERWELIEGVPYNMTPAPSRKHQDISRELMFEFTGYLRGKSCKVYDAPFDVRLFPENKSDKEIDTVVQPDIVVVCDERKLDDKGCKGSPDLIVEILSPATAFTDKKTKFNLYEKASVREYWIVDPYHEFIEVYQLNHAGQYEVPKAYSKTDQLKVEIFEDLTIDLRNIFSDRATFETEKM